MQTDFNITVVLTTDFFFTRICHTSNGSSERRKKNQFSADIFMSTSKDLDFAADISPLSHGFQDTQAKHNPLT